MGRSARQFDKDHGSTRQRFTSLGYLGALSQQLWESQPTNSKCPHAQHATSRDSVAAGKPIANYF
jgi:hypothetical protein